MKYQLAIFDLDGTILDTLEDLTISLNVALEQSGYPKRSIEEVRCFVGNGIRKLMERGVPEGTPVSEIDRVHERFTAHYQAHCADHTKPYTGIPELLHALRETGIRTAVVSNKADYAVQELCEQYFPGLFDVVVGERTGIARKPAPDSVQEVLHRIGISKEHQERIFERFYRVDKSRSKSTGGTGLGLAIVKHIVARNGARMELASEVGKGTEIRIYFDKAA